MLPFTYAELSLYVLATLVFFIDLFDLLVRLYFRWEKTLPVHGFAVAPTSVPLLIGTFSSYEARLHLRPYALAVSVFNIGAGLDDVLEALQPFRDRLWVIDDGSNDDTWLRLQRAGIRCVQGGRNRQKPGAIRALIAQLPKEIETVIVLDPDCRITTPRPELEQLLFEFQRSGMAAICPHLSIKTNGWLTRLQSLEYALAFSLGRKSLGDTTITSGVAVYRREAIAKSLERHSLSVYAEDLENTLLLLSQGERVYYDGRLRIETEAKHTIPTLFSQRVGWHFGLFRVYVERWRLIIGQISRSFAFVYQFVLYTGILSLAFHPLKLLGIGLMALSGANLLDNIAGTAIIRDTILTNPIYCVAFYIKYLLLILAAIPLAVPRRERAKAMSVAPAFPLYAISLVIPSTFGYLNWFALRLWGRRVYRDHYQPA